MMNINEYVMQFACIRTMNTDVLVSDKVAICLIYKFRENLNDGQVKNRMVFRSSSCFESCLTNLFHYSRNI